MSSGEPTLESATYSWPYENTGSGKNTTTRLRVCPWLLFIVMANANLAENWRLVNLNGYLPSEGASGTRDNAICSPLNCATAYSAIKVYVLT